MKHQRFCSTCSIFAFVGEFESKLLINGAEDSIDLSENNIKECNFLGTGCSEAIYTNEIANLLAKTGTVLESCDPYVTEDQGVCITDCPYQHTLLQWSIISTNVIPDTETLKHYVHEYGPVSTSVWTGDHGDLAWANRFNNYTGGVLYRAGEVSSTNHGVVIIGWDDTLTHPGGSGAWIVRNSWGTLWGSNCDYGTEQGYFYIAYGSANIGWNSAYVSEWQDYNENEELLYYDEGGSTAWCPGFLMGYTPNGTAWALATFDVDGFTELTGVEFWTFDATSDVDVSIYRGFDGSQPTSLRYQNHDNQFAEAGYRRVAIDPPLVVPGGTVVVVVKITNAAEIYKTISADSQGPLDGRTYFSPDGSPGSWTQMTDRDAGIRLRAAPAVIDFVYCQLPLIVKAHTLPLRPTVTPTRPSPTVTPTPTSESGLLYLYDHTGSQQLAVAEDWEGSLWSSDGEAELVTDPKGTYGQVARVYVRGYGHGDEVSWVKGSLTVPSSADVVAIPLASALNGDVNETDSEAGVEIAVYDPASQLTVTTYASHLYETGLGVDYIVAFADVSEFRGPHLVRLL
jgi:C1A family cysteine protease